MSQSQHNRSWVSKVQDARTKYQAEMGEGTNGSNGAKRSNGKQDETPNGRSKRKRTCQHTR